MVINEILVKSLTMKKEMLVCKINTNGFSINKILTSVKKKYGDHLLGFKQNGGVFIFFSKDLLKQEEYYSLLTSLSIFGKVSRISVEEVDLEALLKDMRGFSYFIKNKT